MLRNRIFTQGGLPIRNTDILTQWSHFLGENDDTREHEILLILLYPFSDVTNCFSALKRVILVFISRVATNEGNKCQNNTRVSAETVRHESSCILTRHNRSINDDKNDALYIWSPCLNRSVFDLLMTSQSIVDDVTMTRQLWRDHMNSDI